MRWKWGRQTWATVSRYRKHNRIRGVDWSRLCAAAVFGQINSSRRAIVWKLDRNLFSICPPLELHRSVGSRLRREQRGGREGGRGGAALCTLQFREISRFTCDTCVASDTESSGSTWERDVKRWDASTRPRTLARPPREGGGGVDFQRVRLRPCSL